MKSIVQRVIIILGITPLFSLIAVKAQTQPNITLKFDSSVVQGDSPYKFTRAIRMLIGAEDNVTIQSSGLKNLQAWKNGEWISYELKSEDPQQAPFDIEIYGKITSFEIADALITEMNVSNCPELKSLSYSTIPLNSINLSKNLLLEYLRCSTTKEGVLSLSNNKKLQYLDCSDCKLESLELKGLKELKFLDCSYNNLRELNLAENIKLQTLRCSNNPLSNLELSMLTELEGLTCSWTNLSSLDISRSKELEGVIITNNPQLTTLIVSSEVSKAEDLSQMDVSNNALRALDVTGLDKLFMIFCEGNKMDGEATSRFISSLPDHSYPHPIHNNKVRIIDTKSNSEGNVCYEDDVKVAWQKGWECEDYNGGKPQRYEGSKPSAGVAIEASTLEVFPNPTKKELQIRGAAPLAEITLFTSRGVVVMRTQCGSDGSTTLDLSQLPQGTYWVKVDQTVVSVIKQ
ncbi:T9SS type A sorting domain-containing protein [Porphyromonas circumdentaria]|uniref:Por secretion system C-terminal sorting domain-containing protein n=1 Tax=Porphyromonas circumdentaria TaxID=29524 RepID=A0A1T4MRD6_9PORP|nr:T9SS type A sorting domain-containing protein [Porphyromonas circumdentaria]MBB6275914.1 hypothetical protein [Porphyromonas circumdentaria]SJZ69335.1 Por secretion system C-terminal sorting domain-containing protein [Porphyromonas circumdentaria]